MRRTMKPPMTKPRCTPPRRKAFAALLALTLVSAAPGAAQTAIPALPPSAMALPHLTVSADMLAGLPRRTVTVSEENGASATYAGVDLDALLVKNGAPHGMDLRGKSAADFVLVTAADGYRVTFALAELDPVLTDKVVLLADTRDGTPLAAKYGPLQIIVPDEKHHMRWIHGVHEIDVISPP